MNIEQKVQAPRRKYVLALVALAVACLGWFYSLEENRLMSAREASKRGSAALDAGRYEEALAEFELALHGMEQSWLVQNGEVAAQVNNVAAACSYLNKADQARAMFLHAIDLRRAERPVDSVELANVLGNYAQFQYLRGEYKEALPALDEAIALRSAHFGYTSLQASFGLVTRGEILQEQGDGDSADQTFVRALEIRTRWLGADDLKVAEVKNALGLLRLQQGKTDDAVTLLQSVIAIRKAKLSEKHPDLATSYNDLSLALRRTGRFREAEKAARRALAIFHAAGLGAQTSAGKALINLGGALSAEGLLSDADKQYEAGTAILERTLPAHHATVAIARHNWARLKRQRGENSAALRLEVDALRDFRVSRGAEHKDTEAALRSCIELAEIVPPLQNARVCEE